MPKLQRGSRKRQPVACEPCRNRKIKCGRGAPPCNSCIRRAVPEQCTYENLVQQPSQTNSPQPASSVSNNLSLSNQQDFFERFRSLESLVHQHIGSSSQSGQASSSQVGHDSLIHISPLPCKNSALTNHPNKGRLVNSPSGHVRYEPPSSIYWKSVFEENGTSSPFDSIQDAEPDHDFCAFFPFEPSESTSVDNLLRDLPPLSYCDMLKARYFAVFSPLFHILHDPTFQTDYDSFRESPHAATPSWLALLFVVLSIAVTALPDDESLLRELGQRSSPPQNIQRLVLRYRKAATRCLTADRFLHRHNIQTLQALVLMIYSINHSRGHSWPLLGMTYNIAQAMGLHIDPSYFGLGRLQAEERRRAWAGLIMLYTIQNTALGDLDSNRLFNEVQLPADISDSDLLHNGIPPPRSGPTEMTYILFKFKLYNISVAVCKQNSAPSPPPQSSIKVLERRILSEQELWNERYLSDTEHAPLESHHMVHVNILYSYSHQLLLLLHRPNFLYSLESYSSQARKESRQRCIDSAKAILRIHKTLAEDREFAPYQWYNNGLGSFHAFHAAVVLAALLISPLRGEEEKNLGSLYSETMLRFEALSHRSAICTRALPILKSLWAAIHRVSTSSAQANANGFEDGSRNVGNITPDTDSFHSASWPSGPQTEMLLSQLRPEQWLAPSSMSWNDWSSLIDYTLAT